MNGKPSSLKMLKSREEILLWFPYIITETFEFVILLCSFILKINFITIKTYFKTFLTYNIFLGKFVKILFSIQFFHLPLPYWGICNFLRIITLIPGTQFPKLGVYIFQNDFWWFGRGKKWTYLKPFDFDVDSDPKSVMCSDKIINKNLYHDFFISISKLNI